MKSVVVFAMSAAMMTAASKSYTGVISDSMCKKSHKEMNMGTDPECTRACVKSHGEKYVLLDAAGKVNKLSDQATPEKFAGQKVIVMGELFDKTGILKVDSIKQAK